MRIIPQQYYLLIKLRDVSADSKLVLPDGTHRFPHGEVIAVGPDCKFCAVGDLILFNVANMIGFETTKEFIVPEGAVFAKYEADNIVELENALT